MAEKTTSQRGKERHKVDLPATLGTGTGVARDLSASGLFVETDACLAVGSQMAITIDLETAGGTLRLTCEAQVARTDTSNGKRGIGARILSCELQPVDY